MSKIGELFDSALEGYARGSNPRYAKQQDARQLARDMYGVQQAIGKTGMAGHPMESALLMLQTANPVLQKHALNGIQEYQNRKSEGIKAFEYESMLSEEDRKRLSQMRGSGWKTVGQPVKTRNPDTKSAVWGVLVENTHTGEQKMQYLDAPIHETAQMVNRGGVSGWEFPPNGGGGGGSSVPRSPANRGVPPAAGDSARSAVNATPGQTNTYGTDPVAPGTVPAVEAEAGASQEPGQESAGGPYAPMNSNARAHIQNMTAVEQAKANQELWNERQKASPKRFFNSVATTTKMNQFSNKVYKALQIIDRWGDAAASKTPEYIESNPGSPSQNLHSNLSSIQSDIVLGAMEALKAASESGSTGFGQMAIPEFNALRDSIQGLNGADTAEQIRENLLDVMVNVERLEWASKVKSKIDDELAATGRTTLPGNMKLLEDAAAYYGVEMPISDADHFRNSVTAERASSPEMIAEQEGYAQWARKYGFDTLGELPKKLGEVDFNLPEETAPPGAGKTMIANDWYDFNKWVEDARKGGQQRREDLEERRVQKGLPPEATAFGVGSIDKITDAAMNLGKSATSGVAKGATSFADAVKNLPNTDAGRTTKVVLTGTIPEIREHFGKQSGVADAVELVRGGDQAEIQAATESAMVRKPGFMDTLEVLITGTPQEIYEHFKQLEE